MNNIPSVLFITRKHPPQIGGMENLSYNLVQNYPGEKKVFSLCKNQIHLVWFIPLSFIKTLLNYKKFDIIHIGDPVLSIIGWIIKKIDKNKPVAVQLHGLDITYSFYSKEANFFKKIKKYIYHTYLNIFLDPSFNAIAISKFTQKLASKYKFNSIKTIPIGVNAIKNQSCLITKKILFKKHGIEIDNKKFIILSVGRLVKRKGISWFTLKVLPYLKNSVFIVVGEGPEKSLLLDIKKKQNNIYLLGNVAEKDKQSFMFIADVFVMPNIHVTNNPEGFGMVNIEASVLGTPVVASKLQGIEDSIKNNETGFLVKTASEKDFILKIKHLQKISKNKRVYTNFCKLIKRKTKKYYSWSNIIKEYIKTFKTY